MRERERDKGDREIKREKKGEKEKEKRERKKERVSTHIYPPPGNVRPRTSKMGVSGSSSRYDVRHCDDDRNYVGWVWLGI